MTLCLQIEKRRIEKGRKGGEKRRFHVSCDYFILTCTNGGPCSDPPGGGLTLLQTLALIYIYRVFYFPTCRFISQHVYREGEGRRCIRLGSGQPIIRRSIIRRSFRMKAILPVLGGHVVCWCRAVRLQSNAGISVLGQNLMGAWDLQGSTKHSILTQDFRASSNPLKVGDEKGAMQPRYTWEGSVPSGRRHG